MAEVPREIQTLLDRPEVQATVLNQPDSVRLRAMALGLSTLHYLKEQEKAGDGTVVDQNEQNNGSELHEDA